MTLLSFLRLVPLSTAGVVRRRQRLRNSRIIAQRPLWDQRRLNLLNQPLALTTPVVIAFNLVWTAYSIPVPLSLTFPLSKSINIVLKNHKRNITWPRRRRRIRRTLNHISINNTLGLISGLEYVWSSGRRHFLGAQGDKCFIFGTNGWCTLIQCATPCASAMGMPATALARHHAW